MFGDTLAHDGVGSFMINMVIWQLLGLYVFGAYGPSSILTTYTTENTVAYNPGSIYHHSYNVYWYNSIVTGLSSFGFAPSSTIQLQNADTFDIGNNQRLSWHLNTGGRGYRAGTITYPGDSMRKVIYYKSCYTPTRTYKYLGISSDWTGAQQACDNEGMQLATIINQNDVDAVKATGIPFDTYTRIGLNDMTTNDVFQWLDGTVKYICV